MRVLVVEDEVNLLTIIKKRLQREYYSVDACADGKEALDFAEVTAYDAVILDIMLPGISRYSGNCGRRVTLCQYFC